MIVVVADDLTGAVELAGLGLGHGLKVEVSMEFSTSVKTDLLVIATDTRSKSESEAIADMVLVSGLLTELAPELIFKKVDSVLRGHVLAELRALMAALGVKKALLVPANPGLGRTIERGKYLIDGEAINETGFAADPEFPAKTANIAGLLRSSDSDIFVRTTEDRLEEDGISVGETAVLADLDLWASRTYPETLLAGGAGFFKSLIRNIQKEPTTHVSPGNISAGRKLFISGTAYKDGTLRIKQLEKDGIVSYMPPSLFTEFLAEDAVEKWAAEIENKLNIYHTAIIAIHPESIPARGIAAPELRERTALVVKSLFERTDIAELIIEGGSTAFCVLATLGIKTLKPITEYAAGVVRCLAKESENLYVTLKPGSYQWPKEVWMF